jgi:PAS domain S-box-containing protein
MDGVTGTDSSVIATAGTTDADEAAAWRAALDAHGIVSATDARGVITDVSVGFCAISGYAAETLIGRTHAVVNSGHHPPVFFAEMWRTIASGRSWRGEICNRARDGRLYWVDSVIFPIFGADGRPRRYVSVRFDITARKQATAELEAALHRFETVAQLSQVGGWSYTPGDPGPVWDAMVRSLHEVPADFTPTKETAAGFYAPEARGVITDAVASAVEHGRNFDVELPFVSGKGREVWVRAIGQPVWRDGRVAQVVGVFQDVTDRRARDIAVARLQARFEAIVQHTPVAIAMRDRFGTIHLANHRYEAMAGRSNIAGLFEADLFSEEISTDHEAKDRAAMAAGGPLTTEDVYIGADGTEATLLTSRFLIEDAVLSDQVICAIGADITEQKVLQARLEAARAEAEAATRAKADFLSAVSHEIRTPMNGVIGMAESLFLADDLTEVQRRGLAVIRDSGKLLVALVNDLLDFAKVERGALTLESVPFHPETLAETVVPAHRVAVAAKGVTLAVEVAAEARAARLGDPLRLQQILHNLIGNAVKFTETGTVTLNIDADDTGGLRLVVRDTGIGMTPEQAAQIFESFTQADPTIARRFGGTGLGLAIVKGLAEAMGGTVALATTPGEGSTFTVVVPLPYAPTDAPAQAAPAQAAAVTLAGRRVLVADDNEINRVVLTAYLERLGLSVTTVDGGRAAVEAARQGGFDALLLDVVMPDLDGPDALAIIHAEAAASHRAAPPAVAVTGQASASEIDACTRAGFAAHLAKPIDAERLATILTLLTAPKKPLLAGLTAAVA